MIEVKFGQGALFGIGGKISPKNLTGRARKIMELKENEDAVIYDNFFEDQTLQDLKGLVDELRDITGGVPIGAKIGAGGKIEEDIDHLLEIGVDYIAIDGGQAATLGAPLFLRMIWESHHYMPSSGCQSFRRKKYERPNQYSLLLADS